MQYPLRTLLLAMAVAPPAAALVWMASQGSRIDPVLLSAAMYAVVAATLYWLWK